MGSAGTLLVCPSDVSLLNIGWYKILQSLNKQLPGTAMK